MTPRRRLSRGRFAVDELEPRFAPALTLGLLPGTVSEAAGAGAATATVSRTGDLSAPLVVSLTSSDTSEATVPASVTIPAGQASATVPVAAVDDPWLDGSQSVTLTVTVGSATVGLDPTFGTGGYQAVPLKYALQPSTPDVAVTADGKLLAAAQGVSTDWAVSRVLAAGGPDASFGVTGTVGLTVPRPVG